MKPLVVILVSVLSLTVFWTPILATDNFCDADPGTEFCEQYDDDAGVNQNARNNVIVGENGILTRVVTILSYIVGVAGIIGVSVGGIMYTMSAGDSARATRGRQFIIVSLVGVAIAIFSQAIVMLLLNRLGS